MRIKALSLVALLLLGLVGFGTAQDWRPGPDNRPYFTPVYIGFVPGLSIPFGTWDVMLAGSVIGGAVHDVHGIMGAGIFNLANDIYGLQGAGVWNRARDVRGVQGAGVFNLAAEVRGAQGSGVFNIADDVYGFQSAGVFNLAKTVQGVQAAGVFNIAGRVRGLQIGVVNVADSLEGIQLGLVNIAKDGVGGVGIYYEPQADFDWIYWQNGGRSLYTVLSAGLPTTDLGSTVENLVVTAGFGTRMGIRSPYMPYLDVEILAAQDLGAQILEAQASGPGDTVVLGFSSPWPELRLRMGLPISRGISVVGGLTMDLDSGSSGIPQALKEGWAIEGQVFDQSFTAYTRWYLGIKI